MPQQSIMTANDEQNQRALGGFAGWLGRGGRHDCDYAVARVCGNRNAARDYWRSALGFYFAGTVSFAHGKSGRLQSSETARRRIDNRRSAFCRRNCRNNFRLVRKTQLPPACYGCDNQHFCAVADYLGRNRTLAGARNKLSWIADRRREFGHAHWLGALFFCFRANSY